MCYVIYTKLHGFSGTVVICCSMSDGNYYFVLCSLNKFKGAVYIRSKCYQSDLVSGSLVALTEKGYVRNTDILSGLSAFFGNVDQRAFHINANNAGKLIVRFHLCCGGKDVHKSVLCKCHGSRTVGGDSVFFFIFQNYFQAFRVGIAEIMSESAVAVNVHQSGKNL